MLPAFVCMILFSFSAICGRRLTRYLGGTEANLSRLILVALMLGAAGYAIGSKFGAAAFPYLFLSGCIGFGIGDLAMFQAYPRIGARRTMVLIQCLAAPFGALAEWAWLGHAPTWTQSAFGVLILSGVAIALAPRKSESEPTHGLFAGVCFGVLAAICQAGGAVMSRKAYAVASAAGEGFSGVRDGVGVAFQRVLGGILVSALFLAYLKFAHKPLMEKKGDWSGAWPWLIASALAGPALGVTFYQWALMIEETNIVLPIIAMTPLMVIPLARFFEGELITRRAILGGVLAVAGVIGLTLAR